jgi:hypothetical protein
MPPERSSIVAEAGADVVHAGQSTMRKSGRRQRRFLARGDAVSADATALRHHAFHESAPFVNQARMQRRPDFRLYHSNALDVLAGLLARQVA